MDRAIRGDGTSGTDLLIACSGTARVQLNITLIYLLNLFQCLEW